LLIIFVHKIVFTKTESCRQTQTSIANDLGQLTIDNATKLKRIISPNFTRPKQCAVRADRRLKSRKHRPMVAEMRLAIEFYSDEKT